MLLFFGMSVSMLSGEHNRVLHRSIDFIGHGDVQTNKNSKATIYIIIKKISNLYCELC